MSDPQRIGDTGRFKAHKNEYEIKQKIWQKYEDIIAKLYEKCNYEIYRIDAKMDPSYRTTELKNKVTRKRDEAVERAKDNREREYRQNGLN